MEKRIKELERTIWLCRESAMSCLDSALICEGRGHDASHHYARQEEFIKEANELTKELRALKHEFLKSMLKFDADGWHYISPRTGRRYDLLEGMGLGSPRNSTSDIIFVVDTEPECYAIAGYMMGASFFDGNDDDIQWIDGIVKKYEKGLQ